MNNLNNIDFFISTRKKYFGSLLQTLKKQRDTIEERNEIYWNICFYGDKIINTFESSN